MKAKILRLTTILIIIVSAHVFFSCASESIPQSAAQKSLPTCYGPYSKRDLPDCEYLANQGDVNAAYKLARYYNDIMHQDIDRAIYWYKRAADLGHLDALRFMFNAYYFGIDAPKNRAKAEEYLQKATDAGAEWAMLITARRFEEKDPGKALNIYKRLAQNNNCFAQARLANAYYSGDITEPNFTLAYFWLLLAQSGGIMRKSEYHNLAGRWHPIGGFFGGKGSCSSLYLSKIESDLESKLQPKYIRLAQDAATNWRKGQQEPTLSSPEMVWAKVKEKPEPTREAPKPYAVQLPKWTPLPVSAEKPALKSLKNKSMPFEEVSRSVWLVIAAHSEKDLKRGKGAIGSAVAITQTQLLTNCHVIEKRPLVWLKKGKQIIRAEVISADIKTDRCILTTNKALLDPVRGIRKYNGLKVGEEVYTVGSPSGLESTLGSGIISGLRKLDGTLLVQTTAQISPGSSGGGLFDQSGNLIGITTFILDNAQGLNFAIAVEDYFR